MQAQHPKSLTKPLLSLKSRIPIRTFYSEEERKTPDFRQTGTVCHYGQAASDRYILTLTATDIASGWSRLYSLLNKAHTWTFKALPDIRNSLPLPVLEFHRKQGYPAAFAPAACPVKPHQDPKTGIASVTFSK